MPRAPAKNRRSRPDAQLQHPPSPPPASRWLNVLLAATVLASAWLLFQVQPMVAKRILPWFGGGTAVWTTAMLFFQAALFVGYLYAHLGTKLLAPARQIALHTGLLAAAIVVLVVVRVIPADSWKPAAAADPSLQILLLLAACVGLPYCMLAATAPLVQVWFARANPGVTPYRLYALSNFGSLAALVAYPLAIEPTLGVGAQGVIWSTLFAGFAVICISSGVLSLKAALQASRPAEAPTAPGADAPALPNGPPAIACPGWLQYFFWLALPTCASVLLLAITAYLCQDVASVPLLWIAPMVVYLASFILTFESDRWYHRGFWMPAAMIASYVTIYSWYNSDKFHFTDQVAVNLALLLTLSVICHGELARLRPPAERLTAFYLCISVGGALGGLLAGIVAPLVLPDFYELHISIIAAWALAIAVLASQGSSAMHGSLRHFKRLTAVALLVALAYPMARHAYYRRSNLLASTRNFYGVLKVREPPVTSGEFVYRQLSNGHISHGLQFQFPAIRRLPTQYYHPNSGVGLVLAAPHEAPRRIGVVGLGTGTIAAYAEAGETVRFYEINPADIDFADRYFTFLLDARERGATVDLVLGDARLSLERESPQNYDVLALDAFTSDAIPAHLLTLEAIKLYLSHLKEDGVLALHISNKHLQLSPVAQAAAEAFGLDATIIDAPAGEQPPIGTRSRWVLLHRTTGELVRRKLGVPLAQSGGALPPIAWTDDFNNLVDVVQFE
jgi:hypothetical protein